MITQTRIVVRYAETDRMGIVHHSNYPIWYEVGRTDFCQEMGLPYSQMEAQGIMTPLIEVNSRFIKPAQYEDELDLRTRLLLVDGMRLKFGYEIYKAGEDKPSTPGAPCTFGWTRKPSGPSTLRRFAPNCMPRCAPSWSRINSSHDPRVLAHGSTFSNYLRKMQFSP